MGNGKNPEDGERKADKPGKMTIAEEHGQIKNAKTTREEHGAGQRLHRELEVWPHRVDVVINTEQEYQTTRQQDRNQGFRRESQAGIPPTDQQSDPYAEKKSQKDSDPAEPRQRRNVQVPFQGWRGDPAASRSGVAHISREEERKQQRGCEDSQEEECQLAPPRPEARGAELTSAASPETSFTSPGHMSAQSREKLLVEISCTEL